MLKARRSTISRRLGAVAIATALIAGLAAANAGGASAGSPFAPPGTPTPAPVTTPAPAPVTTPTPGSVAVARTVLYDEGFQNGVNGGGLPLSRFTGVAGDTLTADAYYLDYTQCNGVILSGTETLGGSICSKYANPPQARINAENSMRGQAGALGGFNGLGSSNRAVSFMTANLQLPPNLVELETANPATVPGLTGKFLGFSINSAEVCTDGGPHFVQPSFQLWVKTPALSAVTGGVNPCQLYGGAGTANGLVSVLATSDQIGFRVLNLSGGGIRGNDMGLDDFTVWDQTPQVTNSFSPSELGIGPTSTLTFTVTNTTDVQAKNGWSFANTLPKGLVQVAGTAPTTTCPAGVATATSATQLSMKGNLSAGMVSCTFTVPVTSATAGTYTVTVKNIGTVPYTATDAAAWSDDLTDVIDDATYNNNATGGAVYNAPTLSWTGALAVGASNVTTYTVTVKNPDTTGNHQLKNVVVAPISNCVVGSTDPKCAPPSIPVSGLTATKTASATSAMPGDKVTYTIVLKNSGMVAYTATDPATFSDDITASLDDAVYDNDVTGGATYARPTISWSGPLAVGVSLTFTFSVTINDPDLGDHLLKNTVVSTESNCITGSTDTKCTPPAVKIKDLLLTKTSSAIKATPGDKVTYKITAKNTGQYAYTTADPAKWTDDLTEILDDATYNNDANNGAKYSAPVVSWSGALAVGASLTVTFTVTVKNPDTDGDHVLTNTVVGPIGNCKDDQGSTVDAEATTPVTDPCSPPPTPIKGITVEKTGSVSTTTPGSTVTFTIVVTNTGQVAYTDADSASFSDSLRSVLDDATYNNDVTADAGVAVYNATTQTLSWSGPLDLGDVATVTYSVQVDNPDNGDLVLLNTVVTPNGGNCLAGGSDPDCTAKVTDVPPSGTNGETVSGLPFTGVTSGMQLLSALLMLILGSWLLILAGRRRDEDEEGRHIES